MPAGSVAALVPDVRRIAVLRANAVGDLIFALPALAALRAAYPEAEIVLLARAWHAEFLSARPGPVDRVIVLPPISGLSVPPSPDVPAEAPAEFVRALRREQFDLAIQLHGGGLASNPFIAQLGARVTVGMRARGSAPLDRWIRFNYFHNEILRYLEVVALAGATPVSLEPEVALVPADYAEVAPLGPRGRYVVVHPGATDERRRWPLERFARVADALGRLGYSVVIGGDASERSLVRRCIASMSESAAVIDVAGRVSLGAYAALLAEAAVVLGNDTGPLHLARAVGGRTVTLYLAANMINGGPLTSHTHRTLTSWQTACPVCGVANVDVRCAHQVSFLARIDERDVLDQVRDVLSLDGVSNGIVTASVR